VCARPGCASVQGANERAAKAQRALERQQAAEAEAILADNGNPYEVFRDRKLKTEKKQKVRPCHRDRDRD
jgi:hypothetical protein